MDLEPVIGLEIHVQLKTASKMFCACANVSDETRPNTAVCPVCLAEPGALPVVNAQALALGLQTGLALNATINTRVRFDRKSYFYPDLPKGYQITQFHLPVGVDGTLAYDVDGQARSAAIERVHLEEDAAKLLHRDQATLIDFNRAGTPLLEIVTGPVFHAPGEARAFLEELKLLLRAIGVSDADMEKGQLRVDANVSLRPAGTNELHPKTEIKNLNSFRAIERALTFEVTRQAALWQTGSPPDAASTRGWDDMKGETVERREKEAAHDYRYFPEPDLPPIVYAQQDIERLQKELPELPAAKRTRFGRLYLFTEGDARVLTRDHALANFTEQVISELKDWLKTEDPKSRGATWQVHKREFTKLVANWLINRLVPLFGERGQIVPGKVTAENFAEFLTYVWAEEISAPAAQEVLTAMVETGADPSNIIDERGLRTVKDAQALAGIVDRVLAKFPKQVAEYRSGKTPVLQFLVGKVMAETRGTADPKIVTDVIVHKFQ